MVSHFFAPPQQASQYTLSEKPTEIHWLRFDNTVPLLNAMKILTMRSVENFKCFFNPSIGKTCSARVLQWINNPKE